MQKIEKIKIPQWSKFVLSMIAPFLLLYFRPLGMDFTQSLLAAVLLLVITWWSSNLVKKIPASCLLLVIFVVSKAAPIRTVFSFPLSETFFLIVLSYLFSQGIENSGLPKSTLEPLLFRFVNTPLKALLSIILVFFLTIYIIPQPLSRLIIIAGIYRNFLEKTNAPAQTKSTILFSVFVFYVVVNMAFLDADIIMNTASVGFAGLSMSNGEWSKYMAPPTAIFCVVVLAMMIFIFRKDVLKIRIEPLQQDMIPAKVVMSPKDWIVVGVVVGTMILWMTSGLLGRMIGINVNPTVVTLIGTVLLFGLKVLGKKDFKSIDIATLVFLTAAFSIGGVMKASGIADIVFSYIAGFFPKTMSLLYIAVLILVSMAMHLILGSNTTTFSVLLPGLIIVGDGFLSPEAILFICYTSLASHYILPFHSVGMMIGAANNFFPGRNVGKLGIPLMFVIFLAIFGLYIPWWKLMGLM